MRDRSVRPRASRVRIFLAIAASLTTLVGLLTASSFTPASAATVPGVPTNVVATPTIPGEAVISWSAPASTGGSPITNYRVSYFVVTLFGPVPTTTVDTGTATSVKLSLTIEVPYQVQVVAMNGLGAGPASAPVNITSRGALYHPFNPTRVIDSRSGIGGVAAPIGQVPVTASITAVPPTATAVIVNVGVTAAPRCPAS